MENEQTDVRITLRLEVDVNAEVERWRLAYKEKTGIKISKNQTINYLLKQACEVSHG